MLPAKFYSELIVWQLATELKQEVYRLVRISPANRDFDFRKQIFKAAAGTPQHIIEGFGRIYPGDFARFLTFALGSMNETEGWLSDGVDRGHWSEQELRAGRVLLRRLTPALRNLHRYLSTLPPRTPWRDLVWRDARLSEPVTPGEPGEPDEPDEPGDRVEPKEPT